MRIGQVAPELPVAFGRRPVVVAFLETEAALDPGLAIRAELRGLGTELVLVSPHGLYVFRADDDTEALRTACSSTALRRAWGVRHSALFLVDADRVLRFAHEWDDARGLPEIEVALADAGRTLLEPRLGRREAVTTALVGAFVFAFIDGCKPKPAPVVTTTTAAPGSYEVTLDVNGAAKKVPIDVQTSLLDALRERMGLTGTKKGCDHGQCGACTVLVDERRVLSCMLLCVQAEGSKIVTIEGLAKGDALHPMQEAFVHEDALQCGYCTPGQIMSAVGLLKENRTPSVDQIRHGISGNICRCGAYTNIIAAIQRAGKSA